ncbi:MAG: hypothetical protein ACFFD4_23205 [Candidatus Odinarchaeota archaeon]
MVRKQRDLEKGSGYLFSSSNNLFEGHNMEAIRKLTAIHEE